MSADRQRQRVYDAERRLADQLDFAGRGANAVTVHGSTITLAADVRFGSLDAARAWLAHVRARPWFAARWPGAAADALELRPRRGQRRAHYETGARGGVIAVPAPDNAAGWAMRELVLAHELAHHVVACEVTPAPSAARSSTSTPAAHGGEFAAVMLELVEGVLGAEAHLVLAAAYRDGGVTVHRATRPPHDKEAVGD